MAIRTQIYLEEAQLKQLKIRAGRLKTSVSDLIRQGVNLILDNKNSAKLKDDPLISMIGSVKGQRSDSQSLDKVLYGGK